jgi:hypothetical protein
VLKSVACLGVKKIRLVNVPTVQTITATNISNRMSIVLENKATYDEK